MSQIDDLVKRANASNPQPNGLQVQWQKAHVLLVACKAEASDETALADITALINASEAGLKKNFTLVGSPEIDPGTPEDLSTMESVTTPGVSPPQDNISAGPPPQDQTSGTGASVLPPAPDSSNPVIPGVTKSSDELTFHMTLIGG